MTDLSQYISIRPTPQAADSWAEFSDQPPVKAETAKDDWSGFSDAPPEASKSPQREVPTDQAVLSGAANAASFGFAPVLSGASSASGIPSPDMQQEVDPLEAAKRAATFVARPFVGGAKMLADAISSHPDPAVKDSYERGRKAALEDENLAKEQHPAAFLSGQLMGSLLMPLGVAGGATTAGRVGAAALSGAVGGGLYGAGEATSQGQSAPEVAKGAGLGALTGTAFGTLGSGAMEAGRIGASKIASVVRGHSNTDAEASRRVINALQSDFERNGPTLDRPEIAAANSAGTPRAIVDSGGERTRALARSSANTSPEARQALTEMTQSRFEQQSPRVSGFIRNLTGGGHAGDDVQTLTEAAQRVNGPLYRAAHRAGDRPIWSPELERLTGSPAVEAAIKGAVERGQNRAVKEGYGAFNPPVQITPDGRIIFTRQKMNSHPVSRMDRLEAEMNGQPAPSAAPTGASVKTYPNIQFWDYVQRELRDAASSAERTGRNEEAGALNGIHKQLRAELDRLVPEFGRARQTAASFFGAEDALDAGRKFVMSNADLVEARRALQKMSPAERELFARGFASDLADKIERTGDGRNVLNSVFLANSQARRKIEMALGPQRADQLEALLRAESVVDHARKAMGNSTTARQLAEMGLAGGAVATFEGLKEHDFNPTHILAAALTFGAVRHGAKVVDEKVARRVGELLASDNPALLAKGAQIISSRPILFDALRRATGAASRVGAHDVGPSRAVAGSIAAAQYMTTPSEKPSHGFEPFSDQSQ